MILDSSALIAIVRDEAEGDRLLVAANSARCSISAATLAEAGIVADRKSRAHGERLDRLLALLRVEVVPVTQRHAQLARAAYRRFGQGSGHRAGLNYGDCFSYALAVETGQPLLFVGDDFTATDVPVAVY